MRIIKKSALLDYWELQPASKTGLLHWLTIAKAAQWASFRDVKSTFPHADQAAVKSGRNIVIFNIGGNKFRLIAAIHYNRSLVFILRVLTHREYDNMKWKDFL